jgi:hypothetical protein
MQLFSDCCKYCLNHGYGGDIVIGRQQSDETGRILFDATGPHDIFATLATSTVALASHVQWVARNRKEERNGCAQTDELNLPARRSGGCFPQHGEPGPEPEKRDRF